MTPLAHVGGMPVEELAPALVQVGGVLLLAARVRWAGRRRRAGDRPETTTERRTA